VRAKFFLCEGSKKKKKASNSLMVSGRILWKAKAKEGRKEGRNEGRKERRKEGGRKSKANDHLECQSHHRFPSE